MHEGQRGLRSDRQVPIATDSLLVGRSAELDWLEGCVGQAARGRPVLAWVEGDAGMGKSTLVEELKRRALAIGTNIGVGRAPQDLSVPYLPFAMALRGLLETARHRHGAADDDFVFPFSMFELGAQHIGATHHAQPARDQRERQRLFATVARALLACARRSTVIIVLEDLHWADGATLHLLAEVLASLRDAATCESVPLAVVATLRVIDPEGPNQTLLQRLLREPALSKLQLAGLDEDGVGALLEQASIQKPSRQLVHDVRSVSQGNPLFIQQLAAQMKHAGAIEIRGGYSTTNALSRLSIPQSLNHAIEARLASIDAQTRGLLRLIACIGTEAELAIVCELTQLDESQVQTLAKRAAAFVEHGGSTFRFSHPLIREVLRSEMPPALRAQAHAEVVRVLAHERGPIDPARTISLGNHAIAAGSALDPGRAATYARRAGEEALALFAWTEAGRFFAAAAKLADTAEVAPSARAELHYLAGLCHHHDWDWGPCFDELSRALEVYREVKDARGMAEVLFLRTLCEQTMTPYGGLIDTREQHSVLAELGDEHPVIRGRLLEALSEAHWMAQQPEAAIRLAEAALKLGIDADDGELCQYAAFALGLAQYQQSLARAALSSFRQALWYARRKHDVWLQNQPLQRVTMMLHVVGELADASAMASAALELARQTNDVGEESLAHGNLAALAAAKGELQRVEQHTALAAQAAARSQYPWGAVFALCALAGARCHQGNWQQARDAMDFLLESGRFFHTVGPTVQALGTICIEYLNARESDERDAALAARLTDYAFVVKLAGRDAGALFVQCLLIELAELHDRPDIVRDPYDVLLHAMEHGVLFTSGFVHALPRVAGIAAALLGLTSEADEHFKLALSVTSRAGARLEQVRALEHYAKYLVRHRKADAQARELALSLITEAFPLSVRMGLSPTTRALRSLATEIGGEELEQRKSTLPPDNVGSREIHILRALARGDSELALAEELLLRPPAMAEEIEHVLRKIGVSSRMGAAAYALDTGLLDHDHVLSNASVAILVTDLAGFTELVERLGDARAQQLIQRHNRLMRASLHEHGGSEITHTGDGFMASFTAVDRALEAALDMQRRLGQHNALHTDVALRVRIGVHVGSPLPEERRLFGACVITAVRICAAAAPGNVLVSDGVRSAVVDPTGTAFRFVDQGIFMLKGFAAPQQLYVLEHARPSEAV